MDIKALRGLTGTYNVRANERDSSNSSQSIECIVYFLNNTAHRFFLDRNSKGQVLLDCVFKHIKLIETDFFGLKYNSNDHDTVISSCPSQSPAPNSAQCANERTNGKSSTKKILANNQSSHINEENSISQQNACSPITATSTTITTTTTTSSSSSSSSSSPTPLITIARQKSIGCPNNTKTHQTSGEIASNKSDNNFAPIINKVNNQDRLNESLTNGFSDKLLTARWLDPTKSIKKQCKIGPPFIFHFRVKFYVTDPCRLADDTTRNYLYQQLRFDIFNNRLVVPTCSAILLASYILQSELGDYKQEFLENGYISKYRLLPNQSDDFRRKVIELHKQHKSLSSADAEHNFLEHASKKLDCYGVEFYDAQDTNKNDVKIGVSSNGIIVFNEGKKVNQFSWAKILKIMFKKKIFSIQLRRESGRENLCDTFLEFNLLTNHLCKSFWEECVAQHSFFRLHQPKSPPKKFFSFLNFGSKFQYNGKTEYQTMEESKKRSFSHFSRSPSKRYARVTLPIGRPSWGNSDSINGPEQAQSSNCNNIDEIDEPADMYDYIDRNNVNQIEEVCHKTNNKGNQLDYRNDLADHQPVASSSSRCPKYIPKSLTLKSFMYIDDSSNKKSPTHEVDSGQSSSSAHRNIPKELHLSSNNDLDTSMPSSTKKELKRSESLRIPSSIRGAITLTKKAGASLGNQLPRISESLRNKFLSVGKSGSPGRFNHNNSSKMNAGDSSQNRYPLNSTDNSIHEEVEEEEDEQHDRMTRGGNLDNQSNDRSNSCDSETEFETSSERGPKIVHLLPGKDSRYGFKIKQVSTDKIKKFDSNKKKNLKKCIIIYNLSANSPAANSEPRLYEGDEILSINGIPISGMSVSKVEKMIKSIQRQKSPDLALEVNSHFTNIESDDAKSYMSDSDEINDGRDASNSSTNNKANNCTSTRYTNSKAKTLAYSIQCIKQGLESRKLIEEFERLSRKKEDETLDESRMMENMDKNRYQDILPYDSTRVQLVDSMTGDYINASFVTIPVPSEAVNRYIATQGPLASTCDDFWQMIWEQNSSLIIMVTPLVEGGRIKCHKYWPEERDEIRHGHIMVRNLHEKCKTATIERTIQLTDVKSGEKRLTTQIQYRAWPDHDVPADCRDFLKLVNRVRKHRQLYSQDPIVVHCSAGIGRTGVLILMETAVCFMEAGEPVYPIRILEEMRRQRAMLIQTNSQFQFVADAICKVYDQKKHKKKMKNSYKSNNQAHANHNQH